MINEFDSIGPGASGPMTELLQLALHRAKHETVINGIFGERTFEALKSFQVSLGISCDGIAGPQTWQALMPYLTGFVSYTVQPGDTPDQLASVYGTTIEAVAAANPDACGAMLTAGQTVIIPLGFDVVPDNIRLTSALLSLCVRGLCARYPFLRVSALGRSVMGNEITVLQIGTGANEVFYNASHHANEWITSLLLMRFLESYAKKCAFYDKIFDKNAQLLYIKTTLSLVPMVNPDGVDLVTGGLSSGAYYRDAEALAGQYPDIPFPSGWKANIRGVDLNLQYPAGWENARAVKYEQGATKPGPRDFVGPASLTEPESRALYDFTRAHDFSLTLSFHTQGKTIYWKYLDFEPKNSFETAQKFAFASGYAAEETPIMSGYAGYKDWFISAYNRPGYTIEAGEGVSPLPLSQFSQIYADCLGILTLGLD